MSFKSTYNNIIGSIEQLPSQIDNLKTRVVERHAIASKKHIYRGITWNDKQRNDFNVFWETVYGKQIPDKWHRLYQAMNGTFCVEYIPEIIYTTQIEPKANDRRYAKVFQDKKLVSMIAKSADCRSPETIIGFSSGIFYNNEHSPISLEEVCRLLKGYENVVIKETVGSSSGKGVKFVDLSRKSHMEIKDILFNNGKEFIVQKPIIQHEAYSKLNPDSINTLRLMTYILPSGIYCAPPTLRIGRRNSNVDNIHAGGLVVGIDDNSTLRKCAYELGYGNKTVRYETHPDNGTAFDGYYLPGVEAAIHKAKDMHKHMSHTGIVSWDFAIDSEQNPILVEANIIGQSIWFIQIAHNRGGFGENTKEILQTYA